MTVATCVNQGAFHGASRKSTVGTLAMLDADGAAGHEHPIVTPEWLAGLAISTPITCWTGAALDESLAELGR